jgi:hypothetical protein
VIAIEELEKLVGTDFPTGRFTVAPHEHWLACDVVGLEPWAAGVAYPLWPYYGILMGLGIDLSDLFAMFGASDEDGVMAGETSVRLHRPLEVGATYTVPATCRSIERKHGRTLGTFDLMWFDLQIVDASGEVVAEVGNSFVFPRR